MEKKKGFQILLYDGVVMLADADIIKDDGDVRKGFW